MNEDLPIAYGTATPIGWVKTELGEITQIHMGQSPSGKATNEDGIGLPLVGGASDFKGDTIKPSRFTSIPTKICDPDDLILCIRATIGKLAFAKEPYCLGRGVAGIRPCKGINRNWLKYYLVSDAQKLDASGTGSTFRQIDKSTLVSWKILLPPLNEQRRIVEKLDRIFDRLRRVRDELSHIKKLIDRYRQAILTAAFRGDLTADWREENQKEIFWNKEILRKEISKRQESEIPESWLAISLGDIVDYGKTIKVEPNDIPMDAWILELEDIEKDSSRLLQRVTFEKRLSKSTKNRFFKGDVLYGKLRPYLNKVLIADKDGYCTTEIIPIRPNELISAHYLFYWFKHPRFLEYVDSVSHGIQMPRLGTNAGLKAPLVLAPIEEQKEIVRRIEERFEKIEKIEQEYQKAVKLCDRLEQETLAKAFRGELVPQDPNDEPASVLLERIRAEQQAKTKAKTAKSKKRSGKK